MVPTERALAGDIEAFDNGLDFVDLEDADVLAERNLRGARQGPGGARACPLHVNGEEIDEDRVGQSVVWHDGGVAAYEYVAVQMQAGSNELLLREADRERRRPRQQSASPCSPRGRRPA